MSVDTAPKDRFCDVVMEGGVTSGIIYASAVAELSKHYRFRNIGGSSIGAFAAALTAAAEYSRRYSSGRQAFDALAELPNALAEESGGKTLLQRLFRPQQGTRRLFEIFLATLGHKWKVASFVCGLTQALWQYRLRIVIYLVLTAALALGPFILIWLGWSAPRLPGRDFWPIALGIGSWGLALLMALTFAVILALLSGIVYDVRHGLVPNGFGLCRGNSDRKRDEPADLAGFLHESIQKLVGRDPTNHPPLTFKDLWDAPGAATDFLGFTGSDFDRRAINLEIYVTNLAHGRPYRFPLEEADETGRLFFRIEQMEDYFPEPILKHLLEYARPYRRQSRHDPDTITEADGYLELPREHLPIAVAARLALSFPVLISAVPVWAIDYEPRERSERKFAECWLSDGGLCSNFPIHLFDSFLPKWPTFGISLHTRSRYWPDEKVWLPKRHYQGAGDTWDRFAECKGPLERFKGFLLSLWMATWHWNDMTMMRMPGVRDRVVRVLLDKHEGGVNIKMSKDEILKLARNYGKAAADEFVRKFAQEGSRGWPEHRWVRFNRLLISLRDQIECFAFAAKLDRHALPIGRQIEASRQKAPLCGHPSKEKPIPASEEPLRSEQVQELTFLLEALVKLESGFGNSGDYKPYKAMPRPALRMRHPT